MTVDTKVKIDPTWTINELLATRPESAPVLHSLGIDACCGGSRSVTAAARAAGVDPKTLLRSLETATIATSGSAKPAA